MFNPVAPYRYLLPTVYLFMADIANPDLFVCNCRTWIYLDITHFYEEQPHPSSGSAWPDCPKTVNWAPLLGVGGLDTIYTSVCNFHDSSTFLIFIFLVMEGILWIPRVTLLANYMKVSQSYPSLNSSPHLPCPSVISKLQAWHLI